MTRAFLHAFMWITVLAASLAPLQAAGQTGANEQNVWAAPMGEAPKAQGDDADPCAAGGAEIAAACAEAALTIIAARARRIAQDADTEAAALSALRAFEADNRAHTLTALGAQGRRAEIIFWVAMAIVGLGVLAAMLQFRKVWREKPGDGPQTEISISEKQITIKTAWIGVVLLAMSMAFFALYLTVVYQLAAL